MRSSFLWDVTQSRVWLATDVSGTPISPIFRVQEAQEDTSWPLKMGLIGCPETSLANYQSTLRNTSAVLAVFSFLWPPEQVAKRSAWYSFGTRYESNGTNEERRSRWITTANVGSRWHTGVLRLEGTQNWVQLTPQWWDGEGRVCCGGGGRIVGSDNPPSLVETMPAILKPAMLPHIKQETYTVSPAQNTFDIAWGKYLCYNNHTWSHLFIGFWVFILYYGPWWTPRKHDFAEFEWCKLENCRKLNSI
jgi:hypothetical protein